MFRTFLPSWGPSILVKIFPAKREAAVGTLLLNFSRLTAGKWSFLVYCLAEDCFPAKVYVQNVILLPCLKVNVKLY